MDGETPGSLDMGAQCRPWVRSPQPPLRRSSPGATVFPVDAEDFDELATEQQHEADRRVADRLDALEAERVVQRALELEAEGAQEAGSLGLTADQLERVAEEVGLDPELVQQAIGDVRLSPTPRSRFARFVIPDDLFETTSVEGVSRPNLDRAIHKWMTQNEGLTAGAQLDGGVDWELDLRWRARLLSRALSGGNRMAKIVGGDLRHQVYSIAPDRHRVALESLGRRPLAFARVVLFVGAVLAGLGIMGTAVSNELAFGIPAFLAFFAASAWIAVAGARWWARGIRGAMRRSLSAMIRTVGSSRPRWLPRRNRPKG